MNSLVWVALQNVAPTILAFGIGAEKFLISLSRHVPIAVDVTAAILRIEMMPVVIVCDGCQHPGLHPHPVHCPDLPQLFSQVDFLSILVILGRLHWIL